MGVMYGGYMVLIFNGVVGVCMGGFDSVVGGY